MSKRKLLITAPALKDIEEIKSYTLETYGSRQTKAYDDLIKQALRDLQNDPYCLGSKAREELGRGTRSYHIRYGRSRLDSPISKPRHLILYFEEKETTVVISRILHESMEPIHHITKI